MKMIFFLFFLSQFVFASVKVKVFTSNYPILTLVNTLTKNVNEFQIDSIIPSNFDCGHDYVFTPKDAIKIKNADLVFIVGAGFDDFVKDKIQSVNNKIEVVNLSNGLIKTGENPHIWLSFVYLEVLSEKISTKLIEKNPNSKNAILKNKNEFIKKLQILKNKFLYKINKKLVLISGHGVYSYLFEELNVKHLGSIYKYDEKPISAKDKVSLIKKMKSEKEVLIIQDSLENENAINNFAKENSVKIIKFETFSGGKKLPETPVEEIILSNIDINISRIIQN